MKKGFTLVELIVVISVVAILSLLGLSTYSTVQEDARNSVRKSDLKEMQKALEVYRTENSVYPNTTVGGTDRWFGLCNPNPWSGGVTSTYSGTTGYIPNLAPDFMLRLPADPRNNTVNTSSAREGCRTRNYQNCYLYKSDGVNYKLLSHCTPEGEMNPDDVFFDPCRPTWAWQISSSASVKGVLNSGGTGCVSGSGW